MGKSVLTIACTIILLALPAMAAPPLDMASLFPDLEGWRKDGAAESYSPGTLYEHIDGAAENFLAYGFSKLAVQNYLNGPRWLSAEIYDHATPESAFGIYSSERTQSGSFIQVGAQGYEEEGVLNFVSGPFYVKLNGFGLGSQGAGILRSLAQKLAQGLGAGSALPALLDAFPEAGRVVRSEHYISGHFLGHEFLLPAFTADYERLGMKFRLFLMKADGADAAMALLRRYAALDKANPDPGNGAGVLTVNDPYNGPVRLLRRGKFVCGRIGEGDENDALLNELGNRLPENE